jgi:pimeloyl-ACP methyl ester carboxylesterase
MNKLIEHSLLVPFEKSGHVLFVEERGKFNQALMDFMAAQTVIRRN